MVCLNIEGPPGALQNSKPEAGLLPVSFNLNHSCSLTTQDPFAMLWRFGVHLLCLPSLYLENINEGRKKTKFSEILFPRQRARNWNRKAFS